MTRDETLLQLRPEIAADTSGNPPDSAGYFMHYTLRPVLKLQNDLLLDIFRHHIRKTKGAILQLPAEKRPEYIAHTIRQDLKLRNLFTGVILGQFTASEWQFYHLHEAELSRRIADLLIQRLSDQLGKLV
jgi:hypothetical protein